MRKRYWIQKTGVRKHKGALHRDLGYKPGEKIPESVLREAERNPYHFKHTKRAAERLRHRAQFALNIRKIARRRKQS